VVVRGLGGWVIRYLLRGRFRFHEVPGWVQRQGMSGMDLVEKVPQSLLAIWGIAPVEKALQSQLAIWGTPLMSQWRIAKIFVSSQQAVFYW
jgi:hypothetical protein